MPVSWVTGASSGIGWCLARELARAGEAVVLSARRAEPLERLAAEIEEAGGQALAAPCDVTEIAQVLRAAQEARDRFGRIDRLIANAGGGSRIAIDGFSASLVENMLRLNVLGAANCIQVVLPEMLARGSGHIAAVSSLAALRGMPTGAGYSAAKAAMTAMFESLRVDLEPRGIQVTILLPGFVQTKARRAKPFAISAEAAARRMTAAIMTRRRTAAFPLLMATAAYGVKMLPAAMSDALVRRAGPTTKHRP